MVRKHTKNCPVPLVPTTVDLQVILNEVLAKYKILRVPTKSIHLENGGASPLTFPPVAHLRVYSKCSSYIGLVSGVRRLFFSIWVFFHEHLWITGLPEKGEGISLTRHYHFHPLHWVAGQLLQRAHLREPLVTTNQLTTRALDLQPSSFFYSRKGKITPLL